MNIPSELLERANLGDRKAQLDIDNLMGRSEGTYALIIEEMPKIKKSAETGNIANMVILGNSYYGGYGIKKDYNLAEYWYKKAADNDDHEGLYKLGVLLFLVKDDYENALYYINRAVKKGAVPGVTPEQVSEVLNGLAYFTGR
jgi:TPR repeat protein